MMKLGNWKKISIFIIAIFAMAIFCSCSCSCSETEGEIAVRSLTLSTASLEELNVKKGTTFQISYSLAPTNATVGGVYISTTNSSVVSVVTKELNTAQGVGTFIAENTGVATINFVSKDGGINKRCEVKVYDPTPLSAPENIHFDGKKLVWDSVTKDTSGFDKKCSELYTVSIVEGNNNKITTNTTSNELLSSSSFEFEENVMYSVTVQAKGDDIKNTNSEISEEYKFYIIGAPTINVEYGKVEWSNSTSDEGRLPNYYIFQYLESGKYDILSDNSIDLTENHLDVNDFHITVQPVRVPSGKTKSEVEEYIKGQIEADSLIHYIDDKIDFISVKKSKEVSLHRAVKPNTICLNNVNSNNVTKYSELTWKGEKLDYSEKIKYNLVFAKKDDTSKVVEITLSAGEISYTLGSSFITDVVNKLNENVIEEKGFSFTTYSVQIQPQLSKEEFKDEIIIDGSYSKICYFNYFHIVSSSTLNININTKEGTLTYEKPSYNNESQFSALEFKFQQGSVERIVRPKAESIDLKTELIGLQGSYNIYVNLIGKTNESNESNNDLGTMNILNLKVVNENGVAESIKSIGAPTGLEISNDGTIKWNGVDGANSYMVELIDDSNTIYNATKKASSVTKYEYKIEDLLTENEKTYSDLVTNKEYKIRILSHSNEEGVIGSASEEISFTKLSQVEKIKFENGTFSWGRLEHIDGYKVKLNNSNYVKLDPDITSINIYENVTLSNAIRAGENKFCIQAIGAGSYNTLDAMETSRAVSRAIIPSIQELENSKLTWDENANVGDYYNLTIYDEDGGKITTIEELDINEFDLSSLNYRTKICVSVNKYSNSTIKSEESSKFYFQRLNLTGVDVCLKEDGYYYLIWNNTEGANFYTINGLNDNGITIESGSIYYKQLENRFEYPLSNLEAKKYTISIKADVSTVYTSAENTKDDYALVQSPNIEITIIKMNSPEFSKNKDTSIITWNLKNSDLYEQYKNRVSGYSVNVTKDGENIEGVVNNVGPDSNGINFANLDDGNYEIKVKALSFLKQENSNVYVLNSEDATYSVKKLQTVELSVKNGAIVFNRTVEGEANSSIGTKCDIYKIYTNDTQLDEEEYSIGESEDKSKIIISINNSRDEETAYSVIVSCKDTEDNKYLDSNMSVALKAKNINVKNFTKLGEYFVFNPSVTENGSDMAESYTITGTFGGEEWYNNTISANDIEYFQNNQYSIPVPEFIKGSGEYKFKIKANGQEVTSGNIKTAYLGDESGVEISVFVLNDPKENQAIIENGVIKLNQYQTSSVLPKSVKLLFKINGNETYKTIDLQYDDIKFSNKIATIQIPEDFLENCTYSLYLQFVGDENLLVSSEEVLVNNKTSVTKSATTSLYVLDGKLCWDEVENSKYKLYENGKLLSYNEADLSIANGIVTLNTDDWTEGKRTLQIQVEKTGCLLSNKSAEFVVTKLPAVEISLTDIGGVKYLVWKGIPEGTSAQKIYIKGDELTLTDTITGGDGNNKWQIPNDKEIGEVKYCYSASGSVNTKNEQSNSGYIDSKISNIISVSYINKYLNVKFNKGIAYWDEIKDVLTYKVSLFNWQENFDGSATSIDEIFTKETSYDLNNFELRNTIYIVVVEIATIDGASSKILTTYIDNSESETNKGVQLLYRYIAKIDEISGYNIYSNLRVENGLFAFDIDSKYFNVFLGLILSVDNTLSDLEFISLKSVLNNTAEDKVKQVLYSFVNFKVKMVNSSNEEQVIDLGAKTPTSYTFSGNKLTIYYAVDETAGKYKISFTPIGNSGQDDFVGIVNGDATAYVTAYKPTFITTPVYKTDVSSINNGCLSFTAPLVNGKSFDGEYIIELSSKNNSLIQKTLIVKTEYDDDDDIWVAINNGGVLNLKLNRCISKGSLDLGVEYTITIYTKGTENSITPSIIENPYLTGVKKLVNETFIALKAPTEFRANNGNLYWSDISEAEGYELYFYNYSDNHYSDTAIQFINDEGEAVDFVKVERGVNTYLLTNVEELPSGRYKVKIIAKGNGNNRLDSAPKESYFYKAGTVSSYIEDGKFVIERIKYLNLNGNGNSIEEAYINQYKFRILERNGSSEINKYDWIAITIPNNEKYYYELPNEYLSSNRDYNIEVCAIGNNSNLLSGDETVGDCYFRKSEAPSNFKLSEDGTLSWEQNNDSDYYLIYLNSTLIYETDSIKYSTENNYININQFIKDNNDYNYGKYNVKVKALKNNPLKESQKSNNTYLISSYSINFNITSIQDPIVKLENGVLNWKNSNFDNLKSDISNVYLKFVGKVKVNDVETETVVKVLCSKNQPLFENKTYYAEYINANNVQYYYIDLTKNNDAGYKIEFIANEEYSIGVSYKGDICDVEANRDYLLSTKENNIAGFEVLDTPKNYQIALNSETASFNASNYMRFDKVANATSYDVKVSYRAGEKVSTYRTYNSITNSNLFKFTSNYCYFAIDSIIALFDSNVSYDDIIIINVRAIGSNWNGSGGNKYISSLYSQNFEIEYPKSPTDLSYNGEGLISWTNRCTGNVEIVVKYVRNSVYAQNMPNNYGITRSFEGIGTVTVTDKIIIQGEEKDTQGKYLLKYLTDKIYSITIQAILVKDTDLEIAGAIKSCTLTSNSCFTLFAGGDGSADNPFEISYETQLENISKYLDYNFVLSNNIAMTKKIKPIGSKESTTSTYYDGNAHEFTGTLSGGNFSISNIKLSAGSGSNNQYSYIGLFYGLSEDAKIENLSLTFANVNTPTETDNIIYIQNGILGGGGLIANENNGTINNVNVYGNINITMNGNGQKVFVGGLAYINNGTITSSSGSHILLNISIKSGFSYIGGVCYENNGTIENYGVEGDFKAQDIGGISYCNKGVIKTCYVNSNFVLDGENVNRNSVPYYIGGAVGESESGSSIYGVYVIVTVQYMKLASDTITYIGALVGSCKGGTLERIYCESNVTASGENINGTVTTGKVFGSYTLNNNICTNVYFNSANNGDDISGNGNATGGAENADLTTNNNILGQLNNGYEDILFKIVANKIMLSWE